MTQRSMASIITFTTHLSLNSVFRVSYLNYKYRLQTIRDLQNRDELSQVKRLPLSDQVFKDSQAKPSHFKRTTLNTRQISHHL